MQASESTISGVGDPPGPLRTPDSSPSLIFPILSLFGRILFPDPLI